MSTATLTPPIAIPSHQALEIAEKDASNAYGDLSHYHIRIRQESDNWFVDYEFKNKRMQGGGPHYVIHSVTGEILSKRYEQ